MVGKEGTHRRFCSKNISSRALMVLTRISFSVVCCFLTVCFLPSKHWRQHLSELHLSEHQLVNEQHLSEQHLSEQHLGNEHMSRRLSTPWPRCISWSATWRPPAAHRAPTPPPRRRRQPRRDRSDWHDHGERRAPAGRPAEKVSRCWPMLSCGGGIDCAT